MKTSSSNCKVQIPNSKVQIFLIMAVLLTAYVHGTEPGTIFRTLNMDGNAITNAATPDANSPPSQLTTKEYVDNATNAIIVTPLSTVSNQFLLTSGGNAMTGQLNAGTNKVTNVADPTENLDAVNLKYMNTKLQTELQALYAFLGVKSVKKAEADDDVVFLGTVNDPTIDTLEWDLQSFPTVTNLQFSPFYISRDLITAEQYCKFLNAWSNRFSTKTAPACAVTSVMNTAQGGAWVDVQSSAQLCSIGSSTAKNQPQINWNGSSYVVNAYPDDPMIYVSWYGAVGYCQWLNEVEFGGNTTLWKYRLPTEWEYEFQMGAKQVSETRGSTQDWGSASWTYGQANDTISSTVNATDWVNCNNVYGYVVTVGGKGGDGRNARNTFGAYDMSGQVYKWCLDWSGASSGASGKDYVRKSGSGRSIRGGYWERSASYCAASYRRYYDPADRFNHIGFRVVCEPL
jgi:formylglycine-generating enzyme required for sulfatase activity